jgi:hypothetical protein
MVARMSMTEIVLCSLFASFDQVSASISARQTNSTVDINV